MPYDAPKRYSSTRALFPFEVEEEDGAVNSFVLQEMDGKKLSDYQENMGKRLAWKGGKTAGLKDFKDIQIALLDKVTREATFTYSDDGQITDIALGPKVGADRLRDWPASVQADLFDKAQDMNGLKDKEDEEGN